MQAICGNYQARSKLFCFEHPHAVKAGQIKDTLALIRDMLSRLPCHVPEIFKNLYSRRDNPGAKLNFVIPFALVYFLYNFFVRPVASQLSDLLVCIPSLTCGGLMIGYVRMLGWVLVGCPNLVPTRQQITYGIGEKMAQTGRNVRCPCPLYSCIVRTTITCHTACGRPK